MRVIESVSWRGADLLALPCPVPALAEAGKSFLPASQTQCRHQQATLSTGGLATVLFRPARALGFCFFFHGSVI